MQFGYAVDAAEFGVLPDSADPVSRTLALQTAINAAWDDGCRRLFLRHGQYPIFGSLDCSGVLLIGAGAKLGTTIVQTQPGFFEPNPDTSPTFRFTGRRGDVDAVEGGLKDICIDTTVNAGVAVDASGDSFYQPDNLLFENVRIGGGDPDTAGTSLGGTWRAAIKVIGTDRVKTSTTSLGIRSLRIHWLTAFRCRTPAIVLHGIQMGFLDGVGVFTGDNNNPLLANGDHGLWIGGTSTVNSNEIHADKLVLTGPLNITNTKQTRINGQWSVTQKPTGSGLYLVTANILGT